VQLLGGNDVRALAEAEDRSEEDVSERTSVWSSLESSECFESIVDEALVLFKAGFSRWCFVVIWLGMGAAVLAIILSISNGCGVAWTK